MSIARKIALRYLWARRGEAFITILTIISVLGVAIGVMVLNIVMAVMTGFEYELRDKIVDTNSHIIVRRMGGSISNWEETAEIISVQKGVTSVSPFTYHQALIRTGNTASGVLIRGIAKNSSGSAQLDKVMEPGTNVSALFNPPALLSGHGQTSATGSATLPGVIIGRELAQQLNVLIGQPVSVLSPAVTSSPFGLMPRFKRFVVAGIYSSGLVEYESGLAYAALPEAQDFFRMGKSISGLEVRVNDVYAAPKAAQEIFNALSNLGSGFLVQDWTQTNKALWDAIRLEKKVYFIVLLLIIIMASFSIISTLVMIVLEKRKDIAILKTIGASSRTVARIFQFQGATIGFVGTCLGLLLGYLGCIGLREYGFPLDEKVFQMSKLPIRLESINFLVSGGAAFIICWLATIYPSRRASQLEPCEILRYE